MRTAQLVVSFALFLALSFIGLELYQLNRQLAPLAGIAVGFARAAARPEVVETREERNRRLQRETQENMQDAIAIMSTPSPAAKKTPTPSRQRPAER